jgi:hypothetical protein
MFKITIISGIIKQTDEVQICERMVPYQEEGTMLDL